MKSAKTTDRLEVFSKRKKQSILWIQPLNIGFAVGETLPICISELNENTSLRPQEVLDIQSCLEKIRFNGAHWVDEKTMMSSASRFFRNSVGFGRSIEKACSNFNKRSQRTGTKFA